MDDIKTKPAPLGWWIVGKPKGQFQRRIGHMWEGRQGIGPLYLSLFPKPGGLEPEFSGPYATFQELMEYVKKELAKWKR